MKQKDLAVLIAVVVFAAIFALVIGQFLVPAQAKNQTAEVVAPISEQFNLPDKEVFNGEATNPTKLIQIEPSNNNQPFANQ